jgi:HEAT repeat protein
MSDGEDMERERRMFAYRRAMAPVVADLKESGVSVTSIEEVLRDRKTFRVALPTLVLWLQRTQNLDAKDEIVRTLSTKWASPVAAGSLIAEFREAADVNELGIRWVIGSALVQVADDTVLDEIVELAKDRTFGRAREMVVVSLGNMKGERAIDVLIELLDEKDLVGHAVVALGKLRATKARTRVLALLKHEKAWVRTEAKKALAKMGKE